MKTTDERFAPGALESIAHTTPNFRRPHRTSFRAIAARVVIAAITLFLLALASGIRS